MNTDSSFPMSLNEDVRNSRRGRPRLHPEGTKHTQCYIDPATAETLRQAAAELDRPLSWIVKQCVALAIDQVKNRG